VERLRQREAIFRDGAVFGEENPPACDQPLPQRAQSALQAGHALWRRAEEARGFWFTFSIENTSSFSEEKEAKRLLLLPTSGRGGL
jgi:hypothetical protein